MKPFLGGLPAWFACIGVAGVVALALTLVLARRRGFEVATIAGLVMWAYAAAVIAGIVVPMLLDAIVHVCATGRLRLRWSGMTSFWGYLAGAGAVAAICHREHISRARIADLAVMPLGAALVLARLGCFLAGCDYGKVTALPWAVRFPAGSPAWRDHVHAGLIAADSPASLPVHPTQLYEALLGSALVALGTRRMRRDGDLFLVGAATYAIGRLAIELVRGDAERGIYCGVSSGQLFCALVLAAIATVLAARSRDLPLLD